MTARFTCDPGLSIPMVGRLYSYEIDGIVAAEDFLDNGIPVLQKSSPMMPERKYNMETN